MSAIETLKMFAEASTPTGFAMISGYKLDEIIRELEQLEELCRDMYATGVVATDMAILHDGEDWRSFKDRMEQLGLLEEK